MEVADVFLNHPMMILKYDDFVIKKINWENKPQNIFKISEELNLDLDSFVFIDDSEIERNVVVVIVNKEVIMFALVQL